MIRDRVGRRWTEVDTDLERVGAMWWWGVGGLVIERTFRVGPWLPCPYMPRNQKGEIGVPSPGYVTMAPEIF